MKSMRLSGILLLLLCLSFGCSTKSNTDSFVGEPLPGESPPETKPLQIALREGEKKAESGFVERHFIKGTALSSGRVGELRKLFGEGLPTPHEAPEFFRRGSSKPAPRAVTEIGTPEDSEQAPPSNEKRSDLQVSSISPEGKMSRAPRLSISFNSPMIAVSDPEFEELGDPKGIKIEPRPAGRWRWLDTQTLIFEPEGGQFPRATVYRVTVPKGMTDVHGNELKETRTQEFALAPAKVESFSPTTSGQGLSPLIAVVFDQPVDPVRTLQLVRLQQGTHKVPLRRLSWPEAERLEKGATARFKEKGRSRVFFFRPARELNPGRSYTLKVEPGIKSVEGPLLSSEEQTESFSTFEELKLASRTPEEGDTSSPKTSFALRFNNHLSGTKTSENVVSVDPPVENLKVIVNAEQLLIGGKFKAHSTYKVTVSPNLKDIFGQSLGKEMTLEMRTGRVPKELKHGFEEFTLLQPGVEPKLPVFTTNVEKLVLQVNRVEPRDWEAYLGFLETRYDSENGRWNSPPGRELVSKELTLERNPDELVTTYIDLSEYLEEGQGNLVVWVRDPITERNPYSRRQSVTWVQGTRLGIDVEVGAKKGVVLLTELASGKPVSDAEIELGKIKRSTKTDGTCVFDLDNTEAPILLANSENSQAFLPRRTSRWYSNLNWRSENLKTENEWFLFDDRGVYKPGETAHIKGYVRKWQRGPLGQLVLPNPGGEISWELEDSRGNKIEEGKTKIDSSGGLDLELGIPPEVNLGNVYLKLKGEGMGTGTHRLNVQEFRRPEFEVTTTVVSDGPHLLLDSAVVESTAGYYSGGGLAGAEVNWEVGTRPSSFTPPGRDEYTFGKWVPWWDLGCWGFMDYESQDTSYFTHTGRTDDDGAHQLAMDFLEMNPPQATNVEIAAIVTDVNRQKQAATTNILVHPSQRYVGLKGDETFVDDESGFEFKFIVTDIEGRILPGVPVSLELLKVDYTYGGDQGYQRSETPVEEKSLTSSEVPEIVTLFPKEGGTYRIRATVFDKNGRLNQTEYTFWKAGAQLPSSDKVEVEELTVVPNQKEYKPGDTARLLVMAPFAMGEGMVAWDRDGLLREERFTVKNGTAVLELPVNEELVPNVSASITVVGKAPRGGGERPAVASASLNLAVSTESRRLTVEIEPGKVKLEPGAEVDLPVLVQDYQGRPVSDADVTLWVVDEAVLGLAGYRVPEPLARFYHNRRSQLSAGHNREYIVLGEPEPAPPAPPVPLLGDAPILGTLFRNGGRLDNDGVRQGGGLTTVPGDGYLNYDRRISRYADDIDAGAEFSEYGSEFSEQYGFDVNETIRVDGEWSHSNYLNGLKGPKKFTIRKDFNSLAVFQAGLRTDASGYTTVRTKLPDNLTRYRIIAVAAKDADKFGHADSSLTARLPLMVRPSLPRFLNFGDKAGLPVVLQNQTDQEMTVELVAEATGVTLLGAPGQRVKVPANDRVEVLFEAQADTVGRALFRFGAVSGEFSDAATLRLPVYTPASTEEFAAYGQISDNGAVAQKVKRPDNVWPQFGGLKVSLSSTALSELTDAFLYLYNYPYECSEQKSSRMISMMTMGGVLGALNPEGIPSKQEVNQRIRVDIRHLEQLQSDDGGWHYWVKGKDSNPFVSIHVMHALARAQLGGYKVKSTTLSAGKEYLQKVESVCRRRKLDESTARSCHAYALYVRDLLKDPDVAAAKTLFKATTETNNPDLEALGWLWPTLSKHAKGSAELKELKRLVLNQATQTSATAQFTTDVSQAEKYVTLHSSRRTDAILLNGLLTDEAANPLATKLVRGLLAHRTKGRWKNTQENIWVLLALQSYFNAYEKEATNFTSGVWLDGSFLGEEKFAGRSDKEAQLTRPMSELGDREQELILSKQGSGRLYYRVGMKYIPKDLRVAAESRGFTVERTYKAVDRPEDVQQRDNGDWKIKAGAKVEVTLTMVCPQRRYHVALVDQLPGGLETLNPALKGTPKVPESNQSRWWSWYEHDNLRDERVEAFSSSVSPGVYTYSYTALATTPGEYVLPPLRAEEMYSPEVFGRTATGRVIIE